MPRLLADLTPLKRSSAYRRMWVGMSLSAMGSNIALVAVSLQVFSITGQSLYVGILGIFALVPLVVFGLYGGSIADVHDRRRVALVSAGIMWASSAGMAIQAWAGLHNIGVLYLLVALNSAGTAINQPTRSAIIPQLVGKELLPAANALGMITFTMAAMIGPMVGGFLVASVGYGWTYTLDVLSFAFAWWGLFTLPPLKPVGATGTPGLRSVLEGFAFLATRPNVRGTFVIDLIAMITAAPRALIPAIGALALGGGEATAGALLAAIALGSFLAGLFSGPLGAVRRQGLAVLWSVAAWGLCIGVLGLTVLAAGRDTDGVVSLWVVPALLACTAAGVADSISSVFRSTILQSAAPDHLRGRLSGVFVVVVAGGPRIGDAVAGGATTLFSEGTVLFLGGLLCIALTAVMAWRQPGFRDYDARHPTP
ncbi:MFS transporter [Tersicoccus sp. Bi-70]|uniref:MFS transporter n=1 Tax=Tersicoccus sp. Bi-70 TaxID=1897634 RepID=UPI000977F1F0|nr:MFS transporter [Tersicoccus sp. Bi-70]OMH34888.1 MFS transporter [Tersicoccus sp. Bi-70]